LPKTEDHEYQHMKRQPTQNINGNTRPNQNAFLSHAMWFLAMMVEGASAVPADLPSILPSTLPSKFRHSNDTREVVEHTRRYDMDCQYADPNPGPGDGCNNSSQLTATKTTHYQCGELASAASTGDSLFDFTAALNKCEAFWREDVRVRLYVFCSDDGSSIYKAWYVEDDGGMPMPLVDLLDSDVWKNKEEIKDCYDGLGFVDEEVDFSDSTQQCKNTDATVSATILTPGRCSATVPPLECHRTNKGHCYGGCEVGHCESRCCTDYGGATQSGCCTASGEGSEKLSFTQFRYDLRESSYRCGDDGSCQHAQNGTTLRQCQSMADKVRETHTTTTTTIPEPSSNTFQCLSGQCVPAHTGVGIEKCENLCGSGHGDDFRKGQVVV